MPARRRQAGRPPIPTQPRKHAAPIQMRSIAWPVPNRRELYPNLAAGRRPRFRNSVEIDAAVLRTRRIASSSTGGRRQRPVPAEETRTCNGKRSAGSMGWSAPARCSEKFQSQYTIRMRPLFTDHCWSTGPDDWCGKQSTGQSVPVRWKAPTVPLLRASAVASAPAVNNHYEPWPTVLEDLICLSTPLHHAQQSAGVTECVEQTRMRSGARDGNERELAASWHVRDGPALTASDGWFIQRRALD